MVCFDMQWIDGFCVENCHVLSRFLHLRERIHDLDSVTRIALRITFLDFEETASLSIVLSLLIHRISSKHDRDTTASMQVAFKLNAPHITRITFSKMSTDFIQFLLSG